MCVSAQNPGNQLNIYKIVCVYVHVKKKVCDQI